MKDSLPSSIFRVDLERVIRNQKNKKVSHLPPFVVNYLKKVIRQKQLNEIVADADGLEGIEFIRKNMQYLNINYEVINQESISPRGKYIFVSNHPLGGIDYYAMMLAISEKFSNIKTLANDLLLHVTPLKNLFLPVNVFGKNKAENRKAIISAMGDPDLQILMFPAGKVSRKEGKKIDDGLWNTGFIRQAIEFQREIVPVFIEGKNSKKFYRLAKIRKLLRIKFNFELLLLPQELIKQRNKTVRVFFGQPIDYKHFMSKEKSVREYADEIKAIVYHLRQKSCKNVAK
ncbi:MAG: glycerol acyltransferase [Bacteroidia bacterium]|nr:MAG: glycerol acyltransferase [Bacteroidia bacterium]